ncbi:MAG: hypothetical protein IJT62_08640 [Oscillospiraceae bacterium]|nr:hypothetical protein [Oscillospiraceae bacterium]
MKRLVLLAAALLALTAAGCTSRAETAAVMAEPTAAATAAPTAAPTPVPTEAPTPTPEPTPCPHLVWMDGVCQGCGVRCPHEAWENGICAVCGVACRHPSHDRETQLCDRCGKWVPHDMVDGSCDLCSWTPTYETKRVPRELFNYNLHSGTVETLSYTTHDYISERDGAERVDIEKKLTVYLPYGYDPAEKYDLLILEHGIRCTENYWLVDPQEYSPGSQDPVYTARLLDNLIDAGYCRKLIVVAPTFYMNSKDFTLYDRTRDEPQFVREMREDILPLLVNTYSTYARSGDAQAISAARQHFGYAGLSMGSIYAYTSFMPLCLDLFGWYGCFSGSDGYIDQIAASLNTGTNASYPIYYFYNSIGTLDDMFDLHKWQYGYLESLANGITDGVNAAFTPIENAPHEYVAWSTGLYNFLQVAFALPEEF